MCLIAFNWQPNSATPLALIANRDEFYARPTLPLHRWAEADIVAGRDLQAGGTWLGVSTRGRVAALTNYRDVLNQRVDAPSRGQIATEFLQTSASSADFLATLAARAHPYNPFNLLVFDGDSLMGFESRHCSVLALKAGVSAVSNADFDTPWPKLCRLREGFAHHLSRHGDGTPTPSPAREAELFALLAERRVADDAQLPQTGLPLERERALSAEFIHTPSYGTRASSILFVHADRARFVERSFDEHGFTQQTSQDIAWRPKQ